MRKLVFAVLIVSALALSGCAKINAASTSTALTQAAGVMQAISTLPAAPVDAETQKQLAGWQAWAAYLAPLVGVAAKVVVSGM